MKTFRISDEILKKVSHGDGEKIAKASNMTRGTINKAIRDKRGVERITTAINNFYNNNK